jgi:hypothetical protein
MTDESVVKVVMGIVLVVLAHLLISYSFPDCSGRQQPMEGRCYLDSE